MCSPEIDVRGLVLRGSMYHQTFFIRKVRGLVVFYWDICITKLSLLKSSGFSCVLLGSMYHQTFFIPCVLVKEIGAALKLRGGASFETNLRLPWGMVNGGNQIRVIVSIGKHM